MIKQGTKKLPNLPAKLACNGATYKGVKVLNAGFAPDESDANRTCAYVETDTDDEQLVNELLELLERNGNFTLDHENVIQNH